jgi:hypothetical protein
MMRWPYGDRNYKIQKDLSRRYAAFSSILTPIGILIPTIWLLPFWLYEHENTLFMFSVSSGLSVGLISSFVMALYAEPRKLVILNWIDRNEFINRSKKAAENIGYQVSTESDSVMVLEPANTQELSALAIFIRFSDKVAEISGPFSAVRRFRKQADYLFENTLTLDQA